MKNNKLNLIKLPKELKFKGRWRTYQKRVLKELENHLSDRKLNIVAAPGAGKTTLGIEVVCQLGYPALILAPTITIKNQWKKRIIESFLPKEYSADFISTDIKDIKTITSTTYQAIHSILSNKKNIDNFILTLKEHNIKTIVLDEAHHLRTEWYKSLIYICNKLNENNFTIVSLTGTPPYDVSPSEWENYHRLCGPVDAEISIPELVKNGDLCPHQDLIYFCNLDKEELKIVDNYNENREFFFKNLKNNTDFAYSIESSEFLNNFEKNLELIYEDIDFTLALISYLLYEDSMHEKAYILAELLDIPVNKIPPFDYKTAEILFNGIFGKFEKYFKKTTGIKHRLKELNLIYLNKKVDFTGNVNLGKIFRRSKSKLKAIEDITNLETTQLNTKLREVILLDYIGKGDSLGLNVLSIFQILKNKQLPIGILTGTLIVIPESSKKSLYEISSKYGINSTQILTSEFEQGYLRVETYGNIDITQIITDLYTIGDINILIGTQALLGEGWDAPCTNCLIIASTIGSFMSSNQMRGRALRIDKNNLNKTANIWHLAACNHSLSGNDIEALTRRFNTFEGISYIDNNIKSGIERLGINENQDTNQINLIMKNRASDRDILNTKWTQVFKQSEITEQKFTSRMYEIIDAKQKNVPAIYNQIPTSIVKTFFHKKLLNKYMKILHDETFILSKALVQTLQYFGIIISPNPKIQITVKDDLSSVNITLLECSNYERNIFIKSYNEIFKCSDNARYIIKKQANFSLCQKREKFLFKLFNFILSKNKDEYKMPACILSQDKYYFIPEIIGKKQEMAKFFLHFLYSNFGYFDLIYTRNPNGRKELFKAKCDFENNNLKLYKVWI